MSSLGKMVLNLGVNTGSFDTDLGRSARNAQKRSKQIKRGFDVAFKAIATGAAASVTSLGLLVKSLACTVLPQP